MSFDRGAVPGWEDYASVHPVELVGRGVWRTTSCPFHGGGDSLRVNTKSGGWVCMNCGASGGDTLAFHQQIHGMTFREAAEALGCWRDDGKPEGKPTPFPARDALAVLEFESLLAWTAAENLANGITLTDEDRRRLGVAARRISIVREATYATR